MAQWDYAGFVQPPILIGLLTKPFADIPNTKIYWCDAHFDRIEYANMDGTDRRALITDNLPHPFGLSLMGNYLYWTDWQRRAIDRADKESGKLLLY